MKTRDRKGSLPSKRVPDSFFRTVTNSPQWRAWYDEQERRLNNLKSNGRRIIGRGPGAVYDMAEVMECAWISQNHFQDFMAFSALPSGTITDTGAVVK